MNRSIIVYWDVDKINEPMLIDVTKSLKTPDNSMRISIKSLLATRERQYVGTNDECILTYSVNGNIRSISLNQFDFPQISAVIILIKGQIFRTYVFKFSSIMLLKYC